MDILIPEDLENHARVFATLSQLEDHTAAELTPQDFVENVIVATLRASGGPPPVILSLRRTSELF